MNFDHSEIYSLAKHYDKINDFDFDIPFYKKFALKQKGKILELGCGTGRVILPLLKDNFEIIGIDASEEMLQEAKEKASKENLNINVLKQDIVYFELKDKFDLILCVHNSFSHINGIENVKTFFENVKKHLTKDGLFILQVFNPDFYFFTRNPNEKHPLKTYQDPYSDQIVELLENNFYDDESQINYIKWFFKTGKNETVVSFNQRVYFPQELDYIVQFCGFEIVDKFGDFEVTPFEEHPDTQILVLRERK